MSWSTIQSILFRTGGANHLLYLCAFYAAKTSKSSERVIISPSEYVCYVFIWLWNRSWATNLWHSRHKSGGSNRERVDWLGIKKINERLLTRKEDHFKNIAVGIGARSSAWKEMLLWMFNRHWILSRNTQVWLKTLFYRPVSSTIDELYPCAFRLYQCGWHHQWHQLTTVRTICSCVI